jgi:GT2 family glycosyltransferase
MTRVLVALLVYGGREFTPAAVRSAAKMAAESKANVDVLILDDASPHPGWSEELRALCIECGVQYYRTPRNLGIPRNMNLGLLRAESDHYDACVLLNSDVVVPANLVDQLAAVASTDRRIASVTAWSNDVSVYSLPNSSPEALATQERVDAVSSSLADEFGAASVALPVGVGFCLYMPRHAIAEVGIMDPVFGRGYAEEVDWCCRAVEAGFANVLAPGTFVFHAGSATNKHEGILKRGERSVQINESIVDLRHSWYRNELVRWEDEAPMREPTARALRRLVTEAARQRGIVVEATWLHRPRRDGDSRVRVLVSPSGHADGGPGTVIPGAAAVVAEVDGWRLDVPIGPEGVLGSIASLLGRRADEVRILERGPRSSELVVEAERSGVRLRDLARYPERVAPV